MSKILSFLWQSKSRRIFLILCLLTLFDIGMMYYRLTLTGFEAVDWSSFAAIKATRGTPTFVFLVWNLLLAWVPYFIALFINHWRGISPQWVAVGAFAWLMFLPNAPYIITDLVHLRARPPVPFWYDILMMFSFAWTGLLLGFVSVYETQRALQRHFNQQWAIMGVGTALSLVGFGVYLGRFQRWNTWDVLTRPDTLCIDVIHIFIQSTSNFTAIGFALGLSLIFSIGYLLFEGLVRK